MADKIEVDWKRLNELAAEFKSKVNAISKCYEDLDKIYKNIDGNTPVWRGDQQRKFYDGYLELSRVFPYNVSKLNDFATFITDVAESYNDSDQTHIKAADSSEDDLMV